MEISWIWLILAVIFLVGEIFTAGFFLMWFSIGAGLAALLAFLGFQESYQITIFVISSAVLYMYGRKFADRFTTEQPPGIGADRIYDKDGVVIEEIDNEKKTGIVKVGEIEWKARSTKGEKIPAGDLVRVVSVKGVLNMIDVEPQKPAANTVSPAAGDEEEVKGSTDNAPDGKRIENVLRRVGPGWEIKYGGKSYTVKSSVGLFHIRNLITKTGEWVHCSDLKRMISDHSVETKHLPYSNMVAEQLEKENLRLGEDIAPNDIVEKLPLQKIRELKEKLLEQKEADDFETPEEKIDQLDLLDFVEAYLDSVTDQTGKSRKIHDETETNRKAVSAAINRARNNLLEHKELYTHFKSFIKAEGNSFRYQPDRPIDWLTE